MTTFETRSGNLSESMADCILKIRKTVLQVSPHAEEEVENNVCKFSLNGKPLLNVLSHENENEIGITTTVEALDAFRRELGCYKQDNAYTYFPLEKPLPLNLIARIIRFKTDSYEYVKV